jgi:uncharacterized membrane protein YoaK (UPF0700 family)
MERTDVTVRPELPTVLLSAVAGYVDAIGYLSLGQVYTANMSGNSVSTGIYWARWDLDNLWKHGWPIASFVAGLFVSRMILTWGHRNHKKWIAAIAFAVEAIFLAAFLGIQHGTAGVFVLAFAMGVQAAAMSHLGGITVYTCFVTGGLVRFADSLADIAWTFRDGFQQSGVRGGSRAAVAAPAAWLALFFAMNWTFYLGGATAGTVALAAMGPLGVGAAVGVICVFGIAGLRYPWMLRGIG